MCLMRTLHSFFLFFVCNVSFFFVCIGIFTYFLFSAILDMRYVCVDFLVCVCLGFIEFFGSVHLEFGKIWKNILPLFLKMFWSQFCLITFLDNNYTYVRLLDIFSQVTEALFILFSLFSICASVFLVSIDLSSSS